MIKEIRKFFKGLCIKYILGTFLMIQWLRLCALNVGDLGSISGQGAISYIPQLRVCMMQLKIPHAPTKTQHSKYTKNFLKNLSSESEQ